MNNNEIVRILANARFKFRCDTLDNWEAANPVLLAGEFGVVSPSEDNTKRVKIGDGEKNWNDLEWWYGPKGEKGEGKDYTQIINSGESLSIFHSMTAGLYLLKAGSSINYFQSARWVKDSGIFPDGEDSIISVLNVYTDTEVIVSPLYGYNTVPNIYVDGKRYIYINQGVYGSDEIDVMAEKITSDNLYIYEWTGTTNDDRTEAEYTAAFTKQETKSITEEMIDDKISSAIGEALEGDY